MYVCIYVYIACLYCIYCINFACFLKRHFLFKTSYISVCSKALLGMCIKQKV